MKLELKHLSPYFPYELKILNGWGDIKTLNYTHLDDEGNGFIEHIKPILRPMADLAKEIDHNGEKFIPSETLYDDYSMRMDSDNDPYFDYYHIGETDSPFTGYWCVHRMIEWHFDVFGLIEQGLAIDINTLD